MREKIIKRSGTLFRSGYYCAESVLMAVAEHYQVNSDLIPQIATGFCSGLARTCGPCGAVTGAILAISLLKGRKNPDIPVDATYKPVQEFLSRFREVYTTYQCCDLIQCDLTRMEERERFKNEHLIHRCIEIVENATGMIFDVIEEINQY